ncbi:type III secretion system translocon subunit SctE [Chromobacterium phragmitis]|uniref:Translocator protein BipB n=1 Tax=Chromobacterium phragmitis TaxID=2202141 RepID=A0A344UDM9_9NEIS|nr:type III secretion system translocon subunit SctE [Chromobacterium phragmitis]AXE33377.1 pathogenicity island 1 effector protein SipB [Chromobacterium phragmitis]
MSGSTVIGHSPYLSNPELAKAMFEGTRVGEKFVDTAQKTAQALFNTRVADDAGSPRAKRSADLNTPALTPPKKEVDSGSKLTELLGRLMTLLGEVSLSQLESRLATWSALMASQQKQGDELSQAFSSAVDEAKLAGDILQAAVGDFDSATKAANDAQRAAAEAKAKLDAMKPGEPGYEAAKLASDQAALAAQQALGKAKLAGEAAEKARAASVEKNKAADELATKVQGASVNTETAREAGKAHLSNIATLTYLMAQFSKLVGENSEKSLQNDLELFQAMQESRQKEMDKKSSEYQEEVRKSEELNRVMGCVGKILGALLTVVSVVAAAFTGGASLALAAVGVALMVADQVGKAITGVSFMEEAMKPLMEKVIQPLMELISKGLTKALEAFGMDKAKAEKVGAIMGAIVSAIAMIVVVVVVAVVGKGAAAKLGNALARVIGDAIKKLMPKVLKQLADGVGKSIGKTFVQGMQRLGLRTDELSRQMTANTLNKVALGIGAVNTGAQVGGNVSQGVFMKNASDAIAEFTLARAFSEQIEQWLKQAVEAFGSTQKITQQLTSAMSDAMQQNAEASRFVLRHSQA